mmetsp:Transcript_28389/g.65824  ORF Transcript_28389/g.65824 Transcript_28389/m.65824 type:complete len:313 (+) Transcript_28389:669-1607(+)
MLPGGSAALQRPSAIASPMFGFCAALGSASAKVPPSCCDCSPRFRLAICWAYARLCFSNMLWRCKALSSCALTEVTSMCSCSTSRNFSSTFKVTSSSESDSDSESDESAASRNMSSMMWVRCSKPWRTCKFVRLDTLLFSSGFSSRALGSSDVELLSVPRRSGSTRGAGCEALVSTVAAGPSSCTSASKGFKLIGSGMFVVAGDCDVDVCTVAVSGLPVDSSTAIGDSIRLLAGGVRDTAIGSVWAVQFAGGGLAKERLAGGCGCFSAAFGAGLVLPATAVEALLLGAALLSPARPVVAALFVLPGRDPGDP